MLEKHQTDHYNFIPDNPTVVSTGSIKLDEAVTLNEGIHRFCGATGAGKTSEALSVVKNFLEEPKRKALWIKAEGRLSENVRKRSGVKFVYTQEEWDFGTCFVLESNTFEFICETIENVLNISYENGIKIAMVIDSVDALKLKADKGKEYGKERTMGPQLIMKRFLREMNYPIVKYGAVCIAISQVTAAIQPDGYSAPPLTSGGGGNALLHWANYILEFEPRQWGHNIYEDGPNSKYDKDKNKIVGHMAKVRIKKSDKENEHQTIEYPIKHGRENGTSIWTEYEIAEVGQYWKLIENKGSWICFDPEIIKDAEEKLNKGITKDEDKFKVTPKIQGFQNFLEYLEANPKLTKYLFMRIKTVVSK